jgi:hypothetical protein
MASVLNSLSNLPVVVMTFLVGWAQTRYGTTEMMLLEAALGVVCVAGYAALIWHWRTGKAGSRASGVEAAAGGSVEGSSTRALSAVSPPIGQ